MTISMKKLEKQLLFYGKQDIPIFKNRAIYKSIQIQKNMNENWIL